MIAVAALAVMTVASSAARAGIVVDTESGSVGGYTMTNMGISAGTATILISGIPNVNSEMNTVNGANIPAEPVTFGGPVTLLVTQTSPGVYSLALSPSTYTKTIGTGNNVAELTYNVSTGVAPAALPSFFNATGHVTSVVTNNNPLYDFSRFANGNGIFNATFTATAFTGGAASFAGLFSTVGEQAVGNGSFSQIAQVPEPASLALLGIGMTGFLAFRRFFKKTSVA
jgi:hypothetical protein